MSVADVLADLLPTRRRGRLEYPALVTPSGSRVWQVPFAEQGIPVLDCTSLAVFKVVFNRTRDWADLEAMAEAGQRDVVAVGAFLADLIGSDLRLARLAQLG